MLDASAREGPERIEGRLWMSMLGIDIARAGQWRFSAWSCHPRIGEEDVFNLFAAFKIHAGDAAEVRELAAGPACDSLTARQQRVKWNIHITTQSNDDMDDPLSRGLPFELADIWRRSALQAKDRERSLFAPLDASFPPLELDAEPTGNLADELIIPPLDGTNGFQESSRLDPPESDIASPPSEVWDTGQAATDDPASVWDLGLDLCVPPERPRIHTWETFEKKGVSHAERTSYLSEAGPEVFDAALARREGKSNGVLPQDVMLRALCNLAVGRGSVFFQWDGQKACFIRTLNDVSISGYSSTACDSLLQLLMDFATRLRVLRASCTEARSRRMALPCAVAFHGCMNGALDSVEEHITQHMGHMRSALRLQALVERPVKILAVLSELSQIVERASTDEDIISMISDCVHRILSADNSLAGVLRAILRRTSAPWLEKLALDVGLIQDHSKVAEDAAQEEDQPAEVQLNVSFNGAQEDSQAPSTLLMDGDRDLIRDTKASLRILRQRLSAQRTSNEHAQRLYHTALQTDNREEPAGNPTHAMAMANANPMVVDKSLPESQAWANEEIQTGFLALTHQQMSARPRDMTDSSDRLKSAVEVYCSAPSQLEMLSSALTLDINPLDRIRPALLAQHDHLSHTLLTHLFRQNLMHHLELQHAFHCLASGEFVSRLSTALFSTDTQSAERKRGTVPTGQTMGLRLGALTGTSEDKEQRWPPASSELRLALADVLVESYASEYPSRLSSSEGKSKSLLPGDLSFSIRELPDPEIERVMDPNSIYALDFLRLQYTAPAPLDAVLTPQSMQVYDDVFRFLMKVVRVLHVTSTLRRNISSRRDVGGEGETEDRDAERFAQLAHSFITTFFSHLISLGIASPWRAFMHSLKRAEENLLQREQAIGIAALRKMHMACLETIRSRLFLRRKQEKIRLAIENALSAVLKGGVEFEGRMNGSVGVLGELEDAVKELLKLLRAAVDKPLRVRGAATSNEVNEDDAEVMRILLMRLDWNGFYDAEGAIREA